MTARPAFNDRRRPIVLTARLDAEESAQLRALAEASGCSQAELVRRLISRATR